MKKSLLKESVMFVTGRRKDLRVNGPKRIVEAFLNALVASKDLYEAIEEKNVSLSELQALIEHKEELAAAYKKKTGKDWPL